MEDQPVSSVSWAQRALRHARGVANASPGRGSATQAEAQAADYVKTQLAGLGVADIRQLPFRGLRSIWLFFSLAFGMALVGHAAFWLLRAPIGWLAALVITCTAFAMSAFLLWRKLTFRNYPLQESLPQGPSQNVIARLPLKKRQPLQRTRRKVYRIHVPVAMPRCAVPECNLLAVRAELRPLRPSGLNRIL